jgi:T5SS/PEP-CTERM-associated repeat protein
MPPALGTETASGKAAIDGAVWSVRSPDNFGIAIGEGSNATGSLSITNGGAVSVAATSPSLQAGISIGGTGGSAGGTGSLTVDSGGSLTFSTGDTFLFVGRNQSSSSTMTVEGGGTVSGVFTAQIGRDGSNGSLTVDGAGSAITISGSSATRGAGLGVGVVSTPALAPTLGPSTMGALTVQNGGKVTVSTDNNVNGGLSVGVNGAAGNVTVAGAGSQITIAGNNSNLTTELGGGFAVGRSGAGTLNIQTGGQVVINDTGSGGQAGLAIGGAPIQVANGEQPGTGTVIVSGTGSQLKVQSPHGFITSGYSGTGTLNVLNGGTATAEGLTLGRSTGSLGTVSLSGSSSSITLSGNDISGGTGARLQVGGSGTGNMSISNGAELFINPTTVNGGVYLGGTGNLPGGVGTMTVSGGSQVLVSGTGDKLIVGRNGTGSLTITGGGTVVDVAHGPGSTGQTFVGAIPASFSATAPLSGTLIVTNGATLNAGSLLGIASDGVNNSTGTGVVIFKRGTINATKTVIGANGVLDATGTLNGNLTNNGGTISPGAPPDKLQINGNFAQTGGKIDLEIDSDGHGGFVTDKLVFENGVDFGTTGATISFHFLDDADPNAFAADGLFNLDTFFRFANADGTDEVPLSSGIPGMLDTVFVDDTYVATADSFNITSFGFDPNTGVTELVATPTPEPATAGLVATALFAFFGLGHARRRYRLT